MKCIITILQNKRIALPYIFNKYCMPALCKRFNGKIELFHIFHNTHVSTSAMASNKIDASEIKKVEQAILADLFAEATIISHKEINKEMPSLPSFKLALKIARQEKADLHLWMEDDAIIYDKDCNSWATSLGNADAGLYMNTNEKEMINTAYFLSTREFDERFTNILDEFNKNLQVIGSTKGKWNNFAGKGSLIEHCAWRSARKPVYLGPDKAYRHHPHQRHKKTKQMLYSWLYKTIPGIDSLDLNYLNADFAD